MIKALKLAEKYLEKNPKLVNSDKKLYLAVWSGQGLRLTREQRAIFLTNCSPAESISRARRHLQPKFEEYLDPKVALKRRVKAIATRLQLSPRFIRRPRSRVTIARHGRILTTDGRRLKSRTRLSRKAGHKVDGMSYEG